MLFLVGVFIVVAVGVAVGVTYRQQIVGGLKALFYVGLFLVTLAVALALFVGLGWLLVSKDGKVVLSGWLAKASPLPEVFGGFILLWAIWYWIVDHLEDRRQRREALKNGHAPPA